MIGMTWNHRVVHIKLPDDVQEDWYGIHEVFYNDKGVPEMCTTESIAPEAETVEGLQKTLEWMLKALGEPVLEITDFDVGGKYYVALEEWEDGTLEEFINRDKEETNGVA